MKNTLAIVIATVAAAILASPLAALTDPVGTAFTYQGRLTQAGEPVAEPVNLIFRLYETATGGPPLGVLTANGFPVGEDGVVTIDLDFGEGAFTGANRWLEIVVNGITLAPRQPIMAAPYAMVANTAANVPTKAVVGQYTGITGVGTLDSLNVAGNVHLSGKLGIGTALPASSLDILSFTAGFDGMWNRTTGVNSKVYYGYQAGNVLGQHLLDAEDNNWRLRLGTTSTGMTDRLVVNAANGNVGIGTNAPQARLHVSGGDVAVTDGGVVRPPFGTGTNPTYRFGNGSEASGLSSPATNSVSIITAGTERVRVNSVGRVGIGTTSPEWPLHVIGRVFVEGAGMPIRGIKTDGGSFPGVQGESNSTAGTGSGVRGYITNESPGANSAGVYGHNFGTGTNGMGVRGIHAGSGAGVYGESAGATGIGVHGQSRWGVYGVSHVAGADSVGVRGHSSQDGGIGVYGSIDGNTSITSAGIWGKTFGGGTSWAGYFEGSVRVTAALIVSGSKNFLIDNPANPDNEYLVHSCVESDEMKNLYDGVVTLDALGEAVVTLPDWFELLNADFRYQLTCVGGYAPVYIAKELSDGAFLIAGEGPRAIGLKVSWQITGNRIDPAARDSGFRNIIPKPEGERGKFLYPAGYGRPESDRIERMANPMPRKPNGNSEPSDHQLHETAGTLSGEQLLP